MSLMGTYRASGITSSSGFSDRVINMTGFEPSGIGGNAVATCLYVWSGSATTGYWMPLS